MGGTAAAPTTVNNSSFSKSELNNFRMAAVIDRLSICLDNNSRNDDEFENLCLSLSRGIRFCTENLEVPNRSRELPALVKQVCEMKNDTPRQAAIKVLMISVKNACQSGWFSVQESEELINLANQVS